MYLKSALYITLTLIPTSHILLNVYMTVTKVDKRNNRDANNNTPPLYLKVNPGESISLKHLFTFVLCVAIHMHAVPLHSVWMCSASSRCWSSTLQPCCAITVMLVDVRETVGESVWNHSRGLFKYGSATSAPCSQFRKSQIFLPSHTFRQERNEWMLQATGEKGICFMQSDFEICCILSWADFW